MNGARERSICHPPFLWKIFKPLPCTRLHSRHRWWPVQGVMSAAQGRLRRALRTRKAVLTAAVSLGGLALTYYVVYLYAHHSGPTTDASSHNAAWVSMRSSKLVVVRDAVGKPMNKPKADEKWQRRRENVKLAAQETWAVYERHAMGQDELAPLSLAGKNNFGGMAATLVDSLDTLWMLGLHTEFKRARHFIAANLGFETGSRISLFETTIRIIGGLVSAFDLSGDSLFLQKAKVIADKLMPAFDYTPTGIPLNWIFTNWTAAQFQESMKETRSYGLAEFGSIQMEFAALSQRLSNPLYAKKTVPILHKMDEMFPKTGLHTTHFNRDLEPMGGSQLSVGAMADSYYEYQLKMWLLHGKQDEIYRQMWERSTDEALSSLVGQTVEGMTYLGQRFPNTAMEGGAMEHLACYFPGNVALGVIHSAVPQPKAQVYLEQAGNLTYTCWQMYATTLTGLSADMTHFNLTKEGPRMNSDYAASNLLRPETVESLFYMWRATGDEKYREWGWAIFEAFRQHSKTTDGAYASVTNVHLTPVVLMDSMESFWLSETLKYLWLLFSEEDALSISEFVLNTEAHPLRVFT